MWPVQTSGIRGDIKGKRRDKNNTPAFPQETIGSCFDILRYLISPSSLSVSAKTTSLSLMVLVNSLLVCQAGLSMFLAR